MTPNIADLSIVGGRVIALDIPDAGAICPVGTFIGGPVPTSFAAYVAPGAVLDPDRLLVASGWNFGAPSARADQQQGSVISIDPSADKLLIDPWFARADGQSSTLGGHVQMYSAQSPAFLNSINTPAAATANWTAAGNALGISINNAFGRVWFANAPSGLGGPGSNTIVDPTGLPLAGAPCPFAGGVFADNLTNRQPAQVTPGGLTTGAVATALLGKSPDGSGRAVFVVVNADGSLVQVHAGLGVDGLAPAGTIGPLAGSDAPRVGIIWDWSTHNLLVSDPVNDAIVVLHIPDVDGVPVFSVESVTRLAAPGGALAAPIDLAPVKREAQHDEYASNTSLAAGSDFFVVNHRNNTLTRLHPDGSVVGQRDVTLAGPLGIYPWHVRGLTVSPDGTRLWLTLSGPVLLLPCPQGALVELPAF
ncbi:MAG TPA: hypothetical protein VGJ60_05210 [Chloroflexota bacterium]|jgi:hypothetical protein